MPIIKSAKKRMRTSEEARLRNLALKTRVKSARRALFESFPAGDAKVSAQAYREYCSVLDKAAGKGVVKANTAARRKARAANRIRSLAAS